MKNVFIRQSNRVYFLQTNNFIKAFQITLICYAIVLMCLGPCTVHHLLAKQVSAIYCLISAQDSIILLFVYLPLKRNSLLTVKIRGSFNIRTGGEFPPPGT